jgi:hypothetical protein
LIRREKFSNSGIASVETVLGGYEELDSGFGGGINDGVGEVDVGAMEDADYCICVTEMGFQLRTREVDLNMSQI